mmetsp:Transcript_10385/g.18379  ORF Transcript_10385/g.18379 Transcript_10385/m.18379 type:complete len:172 (+) Transcript_10385:108-623(+)
MASKFLSNLPSKKSDSFAVLEQDSSARLIQKPKTYCPTHDTRPPPNQVIETETTDILLRQFLKNNRVAQQKKAGASSLPSKKGLEKGKGRKAGNEEQDGLQNAKGKGEKRSHSFQPNKNSGDSSYEKSCGGGKPAYSSSEEVNPPPGIQRETGEKDGCSDGQKKKKKKRNR